MQPYDSTVLKQYLKRFDQLSPYEFEDMVAEMYRCKNWNDVIVTSRSDDKGRDVIGIDPKSRKVYVEVKKHHHNIGRPVIQKLHSIMIKEGISKGIVVTSSDFTPGAIEYATDLNISLVNGDKFITTCQHLIGQGPRTTSLCTPIRIDNMQMTGKEQLNANIFSYPLKSSEFIREIRNLPFMYKQYYLVNFSIIQQFSNSTGTWNYTMVHNNKNALLSPTNDVFIFPPIELSSLVDLNQMKTYLHQQEIPIEKQKIGTKSIAELKTAIQRSTTEIKKYVGRNNQRYTVTCEPSLKNINFSSIYKYWQLSTGIVMNMPNTIEVGTVFLDNKLVKVICANVSSTVKTPKKIKMCQKCFQLIFKGTMRKKSYRCYNCGAILCEDCTHKQRKILFKGKWCEKCIMELSQARITKKKNKAELKKVKKEYKNWKRLKPMKIEILKANLE